MYKINNLIFNAADLWDVELQDPCPAKKMNLGFAPKGERIPGFGIYSVAYKSPAFGDRIIYLGKYSGTESKHIGDDALAGDVRERWFKHIGSATLLLRNLKMSSEKRYRDQKRRALDFFKGDGVFMSAFDGSFLSLSESILRENVFIKGADLQVSRNRLAFAIQNLKETHKSEPHCKEGLEEILGRFKLFYWQVASSSQVKKSTIDAKLTGGRNSDGVESTIIKKYCDRLPLNAEYIFDLKNKPDRQHYHYDPHKLIEINSNEFNDYSNFIRSQIKMLIF